MRNIITIIGVAIVLSGCSSTSSRVVVINTGTPQVHHIIKAGNSKVIFFNTNEHKVKIHIKVKDRTNGRASILIVKNRKGNRITLMKIKNGQKITMPILVPPGGKVILKCIGWKGFCDYKIIKG